MNERMKRRRVEKEENSGSPMRRHPSKHNKVLYYVILLVLAAIIVFSAVKIISYFKQQSDSEKLQDELVDQFIGDVGTSTDTSTATDEEKAPTPVNEPDTIPVDFEKMVAAYPDVVGYIYAANTGINYPIVKGSSNDYYLTHSIDGSVNNNGSIFMEHLNSSNFSDSNTIIYGHNMKSGRMFAAISNYKNQSYYDAHPYMYIYTPHQNYRLDLFAGFVCDHDDEVYAVSLSQSQLQAMAAKSTFKSNTGVPSSNNVVTLSTCSYEHDNARYVVLGELVPIS